MDKKEREALMDELLIFANDEIESMGQTIKTTHFNFEETGEDGLKFMKTTGVSFEHLALALNACISRDYLKTRVMTGQKYVCLMLTEDGQGRAISVDLADHSPAPKDDTTGVVIGTLNAHGATQIGNNNTQQIENVFASIVERIDQADVPETEKQEAKKLLSSFLEHPLAGTIIGMTPMAIKALCGGG